MTTASRRTPEEIALTITNEFIPANVEGNFHTAMRLTQKIAAAIAAERQAPNTGTRDDAIRQAEVARLVADMETLHNSLNTAEADNAKLRAALAPFAAAAEGWVEMGDTRPVDEDGRITVADLRRAAAFTTTPSAERLGKGEAGLDVKVADGVLTISIGVKALATAVLGGEVFQEGVTIPDPDKFAREIVRELEQEREDGATPIHLLLDRAAKRAAENGAEGIHFPDDDPPASLSSPTEKGGK